LRHSLRVPNLLAIGLHLLKMYPINCKFCYFSTGRGAKYCDERVCMSVSSLAYLKNDTFKLHPIFSTRYLWPWLGLLWRQCNTLCTSGFVNDVMFAKVGHMARG